MAKKNGEKKAYSGDVFATLEEAQGAIARARTEGATPRQTRLFQVAGAWVVAHGAARALWLAWRKEVPGYTLREVKAPPSFDELLASAGALTAEQKAALRKALGGK